MAPSGFRAAHRSALPEPPLLHRLRPGELRAGVPLPYDLLDESGRRILAEGTLPGDDPRVERLIARGVWCDAERHATVLGASDRAPTMTMPRVARVRPWVRVHALRDALDGALEALAAGGTAADRALGTLRDAGAELQRLCALDADAMLAVPLMLEGGRYGTRHAIAAAVVLELMLARRGTPPANRRTATLAALTMNVGMLALQEALYARAGPLDTAQREGVLAHPGTGVALLRAAGVDDPLWLAVVGQHHEHADGSGYPARIAAGALREEAQTLMVAERWCAMVAPRAYRRGAPPDQALRLLRARLGGEADPAIAGLLAEAVGPLPPGTAVRLASGELGLVYRRTRDPATPIVLAFRSATGMTHREGVRRPTSEPRLAIEECVRLDELGPEVDPERIWEAAEVVEADPQGPVAAR